jgi:hypothetical protein
MLFAKLMEELYLFISLIAGCKRWCSITSLAPRERRRKICHEMILREERARGHGSRMGLTPGKAESASRKYRNRKVLEQES